MTGFTTPKGGCFWGLGYSTEATITTSKLEALYVTCMHICVLVIMLVYEGKACNTANLSTVLGTQVSMSVSPVPGPNSARYLSPPTRYLGHAGSTQLVGSASCVNQGLPHADPGVRPSAHIVYSYARNARTPVSACQ